ncbi:MAG: hypothetical protein CL607_13265 [Anaerolineaceae bacterium]|nr:hypothetical protein [Anaerolineaceae bacterium]
MANVALDFVEKQALYDQRRKYLHKALRFVGFRLCNVDVQGLENIPDSGPTIIMTNHISVIDPIVLTAIIPHRYLIAMAKAEAYRGWFTRGVINLWGNYIIRRGEVDRKALKQSIDLLHDGRLLMIAAEGTRCPNGLGEPKDGVAYIAHKTDAVVVPTAIVGAQDWKDRLKRLNKAYASVTFGQPFRFSLNGAPRLTKAMREDMMQEAMYQIAQLIPDEEAEKRGNFQDLANITTEYLNFL